MYENTLNLRLWTVNTRLHDARERRVESETRTRGDQEQRGRPRKSCEMLVFTSLSTLPFERSHTVECMYPIPASTYSFDSLHGSLIALIAEPSFNTVIPPPPPLRDFVPLLRVSKASPDLIPAPHPRSGYKQPRQPSLFSTIIHKQGPRLPVSPILAVNLNFVRTRAERSSCAQSLTYSHLRAFHRASLLITSPLLHVAF